MKLGARKKSKTKKEKTKIMTKELPGYHSSLDRGKKNSSFISSLSHFLLHSLSTLFLIHSFSVLHLLYLSISLPFHLLISITNLYFFSSSLKFSHIFFSYLYLNLLPFYIFFLLSPLCFFLSPHLALFYSFLHLFLFYYSSKLSLSLFSTLCISHPMSLSFPTFCLVQKIRSINLQLDIVINQILLKISVYIVS